MEPTQDPAKVERSIQEEITKLRALQSVADSEQFEAYFDFLLKTVAEKLLWAFTTGKDGDNIKNWDDFCKLRGEVVARLHPIQEVYGSTGMIERLQTSLEAYKQQD